VSRAVGRLTVEGDRAALHFERHLPFPVERVWSAITDPRHRDRWMGKTLIEPREGGSIETVATGPTLPPDLKRMTGWIDLNRLGFWLGAGTQTDVDADPDRVHPADVRTCEHLGHRVAMVTRQFVTGRHLGHRVAVVTPQVVADNVAAQPNRSVSAPAASSAPAR
jgi:hypothetical protein